MPSTVDSTAGRTRRAASAEKPSTRRSREAESRVWFNRREAEHDEGRERRSRREAEDDMDEDKGATRSSRTADRQHSEEKPEEAHPCTAILRQNDRCKEEKQGLIRHRVSLTPTEEDDDTSF